MDYWGGAKGYVGPPSQIIGGGLAPPGPPSSYAYAFFVILEWSPLRLFGSEEVESDIFHFSFCDVCDLLFLLYEIHFMLRVQIPVFVNASRLS